MKHSTKYVSLDVSKDFIAVAIADEGRGNPRYFGQIPNNEESIRKLIKKLDEEECELNFCYEAGPTGYGLYPYRVRNRMLRRRSIFNPNTCERPNEDGPARCNSTSSIIKGWRAYAHLHSNRGR